MRESNAVESPYIVSLPEGCLTPALLIYSRFVDENIKTTIRLLGSDPARWRPHVKTSKLLSTMRRLVAHGVRQCKCSNTLELKTACEAGFSDILLAHLALNANAERVRELAAEFSHLCISVLVETPAHIESWVGTNVGVFVDLCPSGMTRTGIPVTQHAYILSMIDKLGNTQPAFRGLHYYDGHLGQVPFPERQELAHTGYDELMELINFLRSREITVPEVITSGTPTFLAAMAYARFETDHFIHRVSPGTVVYGDRRSLEQLPSSCGYRSAALVASTVVSHPGIDHLTCDAGHKSISTDAGVPTCEVVDQPCLVPLSPSEEHLPLEVRNKARRPGIGDLIYLRPTHVCPTVNNFDYAWTVLDGFAIGMTPVDARGHETCTARSQNSCSSTPNRRLGFIAP